jgi:hypothetical protein
MKEIRILQIIFSPQIEPYQIPAFRGAIASKVGKDSILFHNHLDDKKFRFKYPAIQYKRIHGKAAIVCIEEGVDEIYHFFQQPNMNLNLNGKEIELKLENLRVNTFKMNVWDKMFDYRIHNWAALNDENYKIFSQIETEEEKNAFLEKILISNILSFAKGINWHLDEDKRIKVEIEKIKHQKYIRFKQSKRLCFDVDFRTNVFLPNYIGLGKAPSHGFGIISKRIKE